MADYIVQEDGTSKLTLEDASGSLLLEAQTSFDIGFIASVSAVYAPAQFNVTIPMPFITAGRIDTFPISEDFLGNTAEYENGGGQGYDDFTLTFEQSTPAVFPPDLPEVHADFIASRTVVYAPDVLEVHADFIPSTTALYGPTLTLTGEVTVTTAATYLWLCPPGITQVAVECFGGGGAGAHGSGVSGAGGGGGGAFARGNTIPVTPGSFYTLIVGGQAGDSSFSGDSGSQVVAKGGTNAGVPTHGTGGAASSSIGDIKFSGGDGGDGYGGAGNANGGGGGASGNIVATGNSGTNGTSPAPGSGGVGANGGGSGGAGGNQGSDNAVAGSAPGGGGGGGGGVLGGKPGKAGANGQVLISLGVHASFIASATVVYTPSLPEVLAPFLSTNTVVYTPTLTGVSTTVDPSFIPSVTVVYTPIVQGEAVEPDFIDTVTLVYLPTLERTFSASAVSQLSLEVTVARPAATALTSQLALEVLVPVPIGLHVWQKV